MSSTVQPPKPPSLGDSYREFVSSGYSAVFDDFDQKLSQWWTKAQVADSAGGAPLMPSMGSAGLLTPRQRAARVATSGSITGQEQRLGWARAVNLDTNTIDQESDGWPIGITKLHQAGNLRSDNLIAVTYSIPPVDTPYADVQGVRVYDYSRWPIPAYWQKRDKLSRLNPMLQVHLAPTNFDAALVLSDRTLTQKWIYSFAPGPRATPPEAAPQTILAGSINRWTVITWLEDSQGRPVPIHHCFAELL